MSWARNVPISRKFTYAFGIVCALCLVLGIYTFVTFHSIAQRSDGVSEDAFPSVALLSDARAAMNTMRREDLDLMLCQTPTCAADNSAKREQAIEDHEADLRKYEPLISYPGERELYQKLQGAFEQYKAISDRGAGFVAAGKAGDALDLLGGESATAAFAAALAAINADVDLNVKDGMESAQAATTTSQHAAWINVGLTLLIVTLCALTGGSLTKLIAPRLERGTAAIERLAAKDLTVNVMVTGTDEIGRLGDAINNTANSMRSVLASVAQSADAVSSATTEISTSAVQSASNAQAQSSKSNQIAAAVQEMTATIGEISHNAESAANASRESAQTAEQGGAVMQAAAATMEKIAAATSVVSDKMASLAEPL